MTRKEALARAMIPGSLGSDGYRQYRCSICQRGIFWHPGQLYDKIYYKNQVVCRDADCRIAAEKKASVKP